MHCANLHREWLAGERVGVADLPLLAACGVTAPAVFDRLRVSHVAPVGANNFEPGEHGRRALILRVQQGPLAQAIDLVAWESARPSRWRLRTGTALLLGANAASIESLDDGPLLLAAHPAEWLAMRQRGELASACILDWSPSAVRLALAQAVHRRLVTPSVELGERLERALQPPRRTLDIHVVASAVRQQVPA